MNSSIPSFPPSPSQPIPQMPAPSIKANQDGTISFNVEGSLKTYRIKVLIDDQEQIISENEKNALATSVAQLLNPVVEQIRMQNEVKDLSKLSITPNSIYNENTVVKQLSRADFKDIQAIFEKCLVVPKNQNIAPPQASQSLQPLGNRKVTLQDVKDDSNSIWNWIKEKYSSLPSILDIYHKIFPSTPQVANNNDLVQSTDTDDEEGDDDVELEEQDVDPNHLQQQNTSPLQPQPPSNDLNNSDVQKKNDPV